MDMTCEPHGISACGVCLDLVEPYEPPEPSEGTIRKRYDTPLWQYMYPLYNQEWRAQRTPPAPTQAFGKAVSDAIPPPPDNDHGFGAHRATRNGHLVTARKRVYRAKPQPKPKPKPYRTDPVTEARKAENRALAARLGITLPE